MRQIIRDFHSVDLISLEGAIAMIVITKWE